MTDNGQNRKRILEGVVVSRKMDKTAIVEVKTKFFHPIYKKAVIKRKKFKVHDDKNEAKAGNAVRIMECKPYSKEKRFRLLGIVK